MIHLPLDSQIMIFSKTSKQSCRCQASPTTNSRPTARRRPEPGQKRFLRLDSSPFAPASRTVDPPSPEGNKPSGHRQCPSATRWETQVTSYKLMKVDILYFPTYACTAMIGRCHFALRKVSVTLCIRRIVFIFSCPRLRASF